MIDRLRQMAIFAKTIDHGSFRGAARELNLSPSVVSHHISQLEDQLGVALIYRSTRKHSLTKEGHRLLAATRNMLDAVEGELQRLSESASDPSGDLRLTLPSVLSVSKISDQLASFSRQYPRVKLTVDFSDTRRALIDDGFDFAIRMAPGAKNSATTRKLFSVNRVLVASLAYLENHPALNEPSDTLDLEWITLAPVQKLPLKFTHESTGVSKQIKPQSHMVTNDAQALYRLSRAGAGLAVVPEFLVEEDIASGHMAHVLPSWSMGPIDVFAEWPSNAPKGGLIHLALDHLSGR